MELHLRSEFEKELAAGSFSVGTPSSFQVTPDLQKIMGMLIFLVNPILNPIVYGLKTSEIRNTLLALVKNKRTG